MWEGWLSTSSNMGRPPLLQDSCKRQTIISSCTNSSKVNSYRWVKGATETYPSYAHTPVVKLVLCLAEETLTERKKPISCGASDLLTFTWNNGLQFEIQKLCTIKKKRSLAFLPLQWMGPVHRCACDRVGADNGTSHRGPGHLHRAPLQAEWCVGLNRWVPPLQNEGKEKHGYNWINLFM